MRLIVFIIGFLSCEVLAQSKYNFDIPAQKADSALILFAQQANITLLFPLELAEKEISNALNGSYSIELGLVKLLEGSKLYPSKDEQGIIVKAIVELSTANLLRETVTINPEDRYLSQHIEKIAVVGTRSAPRSVIDSPVPLDIISADEFIGQGSTDILSMLSTVVPSFNVNDQPINDASSLVRPANLRGMASDHSLILINGKRRHRSAAITFLGGGLSDGAQGVDMSNLPAAAIQQVEILRDGAAAQYGSDAIAGVINFVLKDQQQGGTLEVRAGQYSQGDGDLLQLQGNVGAQMGKSGFVNVTAEYKQQGATNRSVQRADAANLVAGGNEFVSHPAQVWGIPKVDYDLKLMLNTGYQLSDESEFYSFSSLAKRRIQGGFYFRNPHTRDGVFDGGSDENGTQLLLVADLDGLGTGIACPNVTITDNNVLNDTDYLLISDPNTSVGQNCFAFNELLPGGFTPQFGGSISDASWVIGLQGKTASYWDYDISAGIGYSDIDYSIDHTVNPSLGPDSPTRFSPGLASQFEQNINLDLFKRFNIDQQLHINFATGFEWRKEYYQQKTGDIASYTVGDLAYDPVTGLSQGFGVGSNGFPGYNPQSAGKWSRSNWAVYTDFEIHTSDAFLFGLAARYEDFNDFGVTFDGKLSARMILSDLLTLRGSISSGFKAPTVGQSNVVNVTTAFSPSGLEDQATLPPSNPISIQLGATPLRPEESINASFGVVGDIAKRFFFTVDYYNISLKDRISTTSALPLSESDIQILIADGITEATSYGSAKYFTNDFDTTTQGIDLVINYETFLLNVPSRLMLTYNWTDTQVDRVTLYPTINALGQSVLQSNLTSQRVKMIEDNLPAHRVSVSIIQTFKELTSNLRVNYYSEIYEDHLDAAAGLDIYAGDELTLDIDFAYRIKSDLTLSAGAKNVFNNSPDKNPFSLEAGALYPATSPIGINGGFYYVRLAYNF
jgi:iron complex outermembrane receptor protein